MIASMVQTGSDRFRYRVGKRDGNILEYGGKTGTVNLLRLPSYTNIF